MYNEGPRAGTDKNLFAITRFSYNKVLFHIILLLLGQRKLSIIQRTLSYGGSLYYRGSTAPQLLNGKI